MEDYKTISVRDVSCQLSYFQDSGNLFFSFTYNNVCQKVDTWTKIVVLLVWCRMSTELWRVATVIVQCWTPKHLEMLWGFFQLLYKDAGIEPAFTPPSLLWGQRTLSVTKLCMLLFRVGAPPQPTSSNPLHYWIICLRIGFGLLCSIDFPFLALITTHYKALC